MGWVAEVYFSFSGTRAEMSGIPRENPAGENHIDGKAFLKGGSRRFVGENYIARRSGAFVEGRSFRCDESQWDFQPAHDDIQELHFRIQNPRGRFCNPIVDEIN